MVHQVAVRGGDVHQGAGLQLPGLGQPHQLGEGPGRDLDKQLAAWFEDPIQLPAKIPKVCGQAVVDHVDAHSQIKGRRGEGQAFQVSPGQPDPPGLRRRRGQALLENSQNLRIQVCSPNQEACLDQGQQLAAHPAAGIQHPAAAGRLPDRQQLHQGGVGGLALHPRIGKNLSPFRHGALGQKGSDAKKLSHSNLSRQSASLNNRFRL